MKEIIKIAWRNIWRNRLRSIVVILSMVLGILGGLFIMAMSIGLNEQRMSGAINSYLSHVQIHNSKYLEDPNINSTINNKEEILAKLKTIPEVEAVSSRSLVVGMISSSKGAFGVQLSGINPEIEKDISSISESLQKGTYFTKFKKNPAVIGQKLAEKLGVKVRSKVVVTFQDVNEELVSTAFRIEGIFKSMSSQFDEYNLFVKQKDLNNIAQLGSNIHEIAILANSLETIDPVIDQIKTVSGNSEVESWDEISPELGYAQEMMATMVYIFMGIIFIALAFGIINTMLMAILERRRELGMLMAVGMNKAKLFSMIIVETVFLSMLAVPIGMLFSYFLIQYFGEVGIDLSVVGKGMEFFGVGTRVYTYLPDNFYFSITFMALLVSLISAIIPARRALRLNPVEAIRAI